MAPSRGIRFPADVADPALARAGAAALAAPTGVLADVSAARLWGLPLPPWIGLSVGAETVAVLPGGVRPVRRGVRGRRLRLPADHVASLGGVPVTTAARTWLDCAELMPIEHLVAMGDAVLRRGLATPAELAATVRWARRRRGVVNARLALPVLDPRAESPSTTGPSIWTSASGATTPPAATCSRIAAGWSSSSRRPTWHTRGPWRRS